MPTGFHYEDERGRPHDAYFHLDKGFMMAFAGVIFAILVQTGSFIWWASNISTSVVEHERRLTGVENWRDSVSKQNEVMVKLQTEVGYIEQRLQRLESTHPRANGQ